MLGSRAIWHDGWKAITNHPTLSGWGHFNDDEWELYHTDVDRGRAAQPRRGRTRTKVRELVNLWFAEAGANEAFPLDDRSRVRDLHDAAAGARRRRATATSTSRTCAEVPESQSVNIRNRSFAIGALVDIPEPGAEGVLFAHGSRFGGHALYVKDNRLHYVYNFVGMLEQKIDATEDLPTGRDLILSASSTRTARTRRGVATGILSLYHGDTEVGEDRIKTQPGKFSIAGEGSASAVTAAPPSPTTTPAPRLALHRRNDQPGRASTSAESRTSTSSARRRHAHARVTATLRRCCGP